MCWTEKLKEAKEQIAPEDIVVYKVFRVKLRIRFFRKTRLELRSPVRKFKYIFNKEYETNMIINSYKTQIDPTDYIYITEGFHSYKDYEDCLSLLNYLGSRHYAIFTCVIPKGAKYYVNHNKEVVSNKIKVLYE